MQTEAARIIDELGGTTVVARAIGAPVSTVHSWRKSRIPHWRVAAIEALASQKRDAPICQRPHGLAAN